MVQSALVFSKKSAAFGLYLVLLFMLIASVTVESGTDNTLPLLLYTTMLVGTYLLFHKFLDKSQKTVCTSGKLRAMSDTLADALLAASTIFILIHFIWLGSVPVVAGAMINDYFDIMRIRQSIFYEAPAFFRYTPNLLLKSIFPFLVVYYYVVKKPKKFWSATIVSTAYGTALMTKMFVVIPVIPVLIYLIINRKFVVAVVVAALPAMALAFLVFVQNPQVRPEFWTKPGDATASGTPLIVESRGQKVVQKATYPMGKFVESIYLRVFVVPGQVVSAWFALIPEKIPLAQGCGYRVIAVLRGCEFQFFPKLVHDLENPALVDAGVRGTMTAATFMEDYANFGIKGLAASGVLLGTLFALLGRIYRDQWQWSLVLNFVPIAMLIELPLPTVILTGGWALTTLLYMIFRQRLYGSDEKHLADIHA